MDPNSLVVVNHIGIIDRQVLSYLLLFSGLYLGAVYLFRRVDPHRRGITAGLYAIASGFLILGPSTLAVFVLVPWLTYNTVLWPSLGNILFVGLYALYLGYFEVFAWNRRHVRALGRLVRRSAPNQKEYATRNLWRKIPVGSILVRILN